MEISTPAPIPTLGVAQLAALQRVVVEQNLTCVTGNEYVVTSPTGQILFKAKEICNMFGMLMGGRHRSFVINVCDSRREQVMELRRPYSLGPERMFVTLCGRPVSVVRQKITWCKKVLRINDASNRPLLYVKGPIRTCVTSDFNIFSQDKQRIGVIRKRFYYFDNSYEIEFPLELDSGLKAAILATSILMDFLYFHSDDCA